MVKKGKCREDGKMTTKMGGRGSLKSQLFFFFFSSNFLPIFCHPRQQRLLFQRLPGGLDIAIQCSLIYPSSTAAAAGADEAVVAHVVGEFIHLRQQFALHQWHSLCHPRPPEGASKLGEEDLKGKTVAD
jgi:hypothetical protein